MAHLLGYAHEDYYCVDGGDGVLSDVPASFRVPGGSRTFAFGTLEHCWEMCVDIGDKVAGWEAGGRDGWTLPSRAEDLWSRGSWVLGSSQCVRPEESREKPQTPS